jgi:DNA (cytosine-5)-methyltransferase 1
MRMLSLFSGIGGIDLAAQWAGIETVAFCEIDPFCQKVLRKHWPEVPIFPDIKQLTKEVLDDAGITGIDVVAGGFPCQPYSVAGKQRGKADDRHLWPEMRRVISESKPSWVVGENVANFVNMELDQALSDLERIGYSCQPLIIPACGVGADHERYRVFIVAHSDSQQTNKQLFGYEQLSRQQGEAVEAGEKAARQADGAAGNNYDTRLYPLLLWPSICSEPPVAGVLHGIPGRLDTGRAVGNAVDPRQIYPIFAAIKAVEEAQKYEPKRSCKNIRHENPTV